MRKIEKKPEPCAPKKHFYSHKIELKIGAWKKQFDFNYVNTIIAMALNHCTKDNAFFINGYLITSNTLYLVAKTDKKAMDGILYKMEQHLSLLIQIHSQKLKKKMYETDDIVDDETILYPIYEPLFELYPLKNNHLIQLITGKKVALPYFDRELERLKFMVKHHSFCSVIDYSGALGPVDVTLLEGRTTHRIIVKK
ncbi:hypothetical protein [Flavobacterium sp. N3904]|uniref:hypothetical protein n=1 Tax=Flavobacterium sp. N3904 TaxID=2986835 RepID=UPI0022253379|nr:hypothetical protein [Flavobacterium sp. N3904]